MRSFMPHQQKAFDYAKNLARIALFMEMRLGKTLVAIRWAEHMKRKRVLVVAPLSVLVSWEEELFKEGYAYEDICWLQGSQEERYLLATGNQEATWFLANYEGLLENNPNYNPDLSRGINSKKRVGSSVLYQDWDCIILDESTRIRNPKAMTTQHLVADSNHIPHKAILTGLPAPESPLDYFEQFRFLHGGFMHCNSYWYFRKRYFRSYGYDWMCNKHVKGLIKESVKQLAFVMTRTQAGIGSKKIYERRIVPMNANQRKLYDEVVRGFQYTHEGETTETKWVPVKYLWMQQIAGGFTPDGKNLSHAKLHEILELLKGELKNEPVVIWFRYDCEVQFVSQALQAKGFSVGIFTGNDKTGDHLFKGGRIQVLCAQQRCGQYGLDWSRASTAIYYSNYYDGEVRAQSEDRIVHPKKSEPLLYLDLVSEKSIDQHVVDLLREKKLNAKQFSMELAERMVESVRTKKKLLCRPRSKRNRMGNVEPKLET